MSTTYLEIERFAGRLHAQIELEVTGRVVPASGVEYDHGGNAVQPAEPARVEDLHPVLAGTVVSLADEDREVWRGKGSWVGARLWAEGFVVRLTDEEKARATDQLIEAWEAEREGDPDRWRDERIDRELTERRSA